MNARTNSQPLSRQFAFIRRRRALERKGSAHGLAARRAPSAFERHRRIKE